MSLILAAFANGSFRRCSLGEIAGPIVKFEVLLLQRRVNQLDFDAAIRSIARLVAGRIGDQILFTKVPLNLGKRVAQVSFMTRKISAAARLLGDLSQRSF